MGYDDDKTIAMEIRMQRMFHLRILTIQTKTIIWMMQMIIRLTMTKCNKLPCMKIS